MGPRARCSISICLPGTESDVPTTCNVGNGTTIVKLMYRVPCMAVMVMALVQWGASTVAASEAIDAWLALPPTARQNACADLLKRAKSTDDRWGQAFLQQTQIADGTTRLRLIDTALAAHPADVEAWFQLARAQALIVNHGFEEDGYGDGSSPIEDWKKDGIKTDDLDLSQSILNITGGRHGNLKLTYDDTKLKVYRDMGSSTAELWKPGQSIPLDPGMYNLLLEGLTAGVAPIIADLHYSVGRLNMLEMGSCRKQSTRRTMTAANFRPGGAEPRRCQQY